MLLQVCLRRWILVFVFSSSYYCHNAAGVTAETPFRTDIIMLESAHGLSMMRFNGPTRTGFSLEAKPTNGYSRISCKVFQPPELIAPTAIIIQYLNELLLL